MVPSTGPIDAGYLKLSSKEQGKILQFQQAILESVIRIEDAKSILEKICLLAEQLLPNSVGSVMLLDESGEHLNAYAAPSVPPEGIVRLNNLHPGPGSGSCGNAVYHKTPQYVRNTFTDPRWKDLRQIAFDFNLCSCWSVPIFLPTGHVIGTFALSSFEHRLPSNFHRKLLKIGASIVGIVLERNKNREALQESRSLLQLIIENAPIRVFWKDRESRYLGCNGTFARDAGFGDPEELIGRTDFELGWRDQAELYHADDQAVMESGIPKLDFEEPSTTPDGQTVWLSTSKVPLRDKNDQIFGVLGIYKDITRRRKLETELRQSEAFFHALTSIAPVGIFHADSQGRYHFVNEYWCRYSGMSQSQTKAFGWEQAIHPDDRERVISKWYEAVTGKSSFIEEYRFQRPDGEVLWVLERAIPDPEEFGEDVGFVGTVTDITERKRLESRMKYYESLVRSSYDAIISKTPNGIITSWNPGAERLFGFTANEMIGKPSLILIPLDRRNEDRIILEKITRGEHIEHFETERLCKDGNLVHISASISPIVDDNGNIIGISKIARDITERKKLQRGQVLMLLEASTKPTLLVGEKGIIEFANTAATELFGYEKRELDGQPVEALVPPRVRKIHLKKREEYLQTPSERPMGHGNLLLAGVRRNGNEFPVEIGLTPLCLDSQDVVLTTVIDITERQRVESELQMAATVYRAIGEAIVVANADNRIVAINPTFTQLTGYSEEEAIGESTKLLRSGVHDQTFYQEMWRSLERTGHWAGEIFDRRKCGKVCRQWLVISTVYDENGEVLQRIGTYSEVTDQKRAQQTVWRHANFDSLTGLPNRRLFYDRLDMAIRKAKRTGLSLSLLFLDIDQFKGVNDTLGHSIGDVLLEEAACRVRSCLRETDTVARLGGDEFTVILGELAPTGTTGIIENVVCKILNKLMQPFRVENEEIHVSASIGITVYPDDANSIKALMTNADQAMYAAKAKGGNQYCYYTPCMQEAAQTKRKITQQLRSAIVQEQFEVHYQPIVELASGALHKAEALIRWIHPEQGLISPGNFIPVAEENGLIGEIGNWVFRKAMEQLKHWHAFTGSRFQISINKSPVEFRDSNGDHMKLLNYFEELSLPQESLVVEITESVLLDANQDIQEKLFQFRDAGVQVAIDDFGTGYSSLSYLKKFDIDYLKIDQSFIRNLTSSSSDLALSEAIVVMAHKLGLKVIAEGVETETQRNMLREMGCDYGQGYFFSEPLPAKEFEIRFIRGFRKL